MGFKDGTAAADTAGGYGNGGPDTSAPPDSGNIDQSVSPDNTIQDTTAPADTTSPTDFTQFGGGLNDLTSLPAGGALPFGGAGGDNLGPVSGNVYGSPGGAGGGGGGGIFGPGVGLDTAGLGLGAGTGLNTGGAYTPPGSPTLANLANMAAGGGGGAGSLGALAGLGGAGLLGTLAGPGGGGFYGGAFPGGFAGMGGGGGGVGLPNPAFAGPQSLSGGPWDPVTTADLSNVGAQQAPATTTAPGGQQSGTAQPDWLKSIASMLGVGSAQAAEEPQTEADTLTPADKAIPFNKFGGTVPAANTSGLSSGVQGTADILGNSRLGNFQLSDFPAGNVASANEAQGLFQQQQFGGPPGVGGVASGKPAPTGDDFQTRSGDTSFGDRFRAGFANAPGTFTDRYSTAPTGNASFDARFAAAPLSGTYQPPTAGSNFPSLTSGQQMPADILGTSFDTDALRNAPSPEGGTTFGARFPGPADIAGGSPSFPSAVANDTATVPTPPAPGSPAATGTAGIDASQIGFDPSGQLGSGVPELGGIPGSNIVSLTDLADFASRTAATTPAPVARSDLTSGQQMPADILGTAFETDALRNAPAPAGGTTFGARFPGPNEFGGGSPAYPGAVANEAPSTQTAATPPPPPTPDQLSANLGLPPLTTAELQPPTVTPPQATTETTPQGPLGGNPNTTTVTGQPATANTPFSQTQTGAALSSTLGLSGNEPPGVGSSTYQQRGPPQPLSAQLRNMLGIPNLHSMIANAMGGGQLGNTVASALLQFGVPAAMVLAGRGPRATNVPLVSGPAAMSGSTTPSMLRNLTPGPGLMRWGIPLTIGQGLDRLGGQSAQPGGPAGAPIGPPEPPIDAQGRTYPSQTSANLSPDNSDASQFITSRGGHTAGAGAPPLDPVFASRVQQAAMAYEAETGRQARFGETGRSYAQQAIYRQRFESGQGGLAARPGTSRHEKGLAIDINEPNFQRWMHQNAYRFGLSGLRDPRDPDHFQMAG